MDSLTARAYTRVTLALDIIRKLPSGPLAGYHELGIIKHQIELHDVITVVDSAEMEIVCSDPQVPVYQSNICWKSAELIKKRFGINRNVRIEIEKNIPVMGGLAGGSTNAAATIQLLCTLWNITPKREELDGIGRQLGMDVPFYFTGGTAFDSESTGVFRSIATGISINFVLVIPPFGVSTRLAYQHIDYTAIAKRCAETAALENALKRDDLAAVAAHLHNDFEHSVFKKYPAFLPIKKDMLEAGCVSAAMSGSGSTMIGIAQSKEHALTIAHRLKESSYHVVLSKTLSPDEDS